MGTSGRRMGRDYSATSQEMPHAASGGRPLVWREMNPPHKTPQRLGAGPSIGREAVVEEGGRPATQEIARRRDGGAGPAVNTPAARGSGDAAVLDRRDEMPSEGISHRAQGARKRECPSPDVVHKVGRKRPRASSGKESTELTATPPESRPRGESTTEPVRDVEPISDDQRYREGRKSDGGNDARTAQRPARDERSKAVNADETVWMPSQTRRTPWSTDAAVTNEDATHRSNLGTRADDDAESQNEVNSDSDLFEAWKQRPGMSHPVDRPPHDRAPTGQRSSNGASGSGGREEWTTGGSEDVYNACGKPPVDGSAAGKKEDEEAASPLSPRRREGRRRRQPSISGSVGQPRLRQRRGSPVERDPGELQVDSQTNRDSVDAGGWSPERDPLFVSDCLILHDEGMNSVDSLTARALLPVPRGGADDDGGRRGERQNEGRAGAAAEGTLDLSGGCGEAAHALHIDARKGGAETDAGGHTGQLRRRRVRGKQAVRPVDATLGIPVTEEGQPAARNTRQGAWGGNAAGAIAAQQNSVHPPVSAGASRSCCSVSGRTDLHVDRHGQALRGAFGAARGTAAAIGEGDSGNRGRVAVGSGGSPSRHTSYSLTAQCPFAEEVHDGLQPASSSGASLLPWAPGGGRPPDGADHAA